MMEPSSRQVLNDLLSRATSSELPDAARFVPLVYDELRAIARKYMREERRDHTLQPTAVVHEAYMRLVDESRVDWNGRTHFRAVCAKVMRRVLIDYARARSRAKRGGGEKPVVLDTVPVPLEVGEVDAIELHDALERLAALDARQARVVELRYYGGLNVDEVARTLSVSKRTVEDDWKHAKAWLRAELGRTSEK